MLAMDFGNFLIPLVLVFCIILAVLWLLGRCKYKVIRKNKDNEEGIIIKLNSGMKIEMCDFVLYCCWSASDSSADVIKYHDKIVVISYQTALSNNIDMEECVICKETFISEKQICTFSCKHYFHVTCIVKWLAQQKRCPLCWTEINNVKTPAVKIV